MKENILGIRWAWYVMVSLAILGSAGCTENRFEIRSAPEDATCIESLFFIGGGEGSTPDGSNSKQESPLTLEELKAMAVDEDNLVRALGYRKYVVHFYRRMDDKDEEISPVKFPLHWDIDSTVLQTEGTFLLEFTSPSEVKFAFSCATCEMIDQKGRLAPARQQDVEVEFTSAPQHRHCTEDWCFSLRPRKVNLGEEVGKQYLVRIESQESYLRAAKQRVQVTQADKGSTFSLRFSDPLAYRATTFVKELGIAMALSDKSKREAEITKELEVLQDSIDHVKHHLVYLEDKGQSTSEKSEQQLVEYLRKETELKMELVSVLPRMLVISPGVPCGKK